VPRIIQAKSSLLKATAKHEPPYFIILTAERRPKLKKLKNL